MILIRLKRVQPFGLSWISTKETTRRKLPRLLKELMDEEKFYASIANIDGRDKRVESVSIDFKIHPRRTR